MTLSLALVPLLFGIWVNGTAPHPPTRAYTPTRCTRYCAAHGCRHATRANSPAYFQLRPVYVATVRGLMLGGKARYAAFNIGLYLGLLPALLLWLTYGVLHNASVIRRLKKQ
ncbi:hypothetical protein FNT36_11340 [Hymenobacter setariae]|uniref:Uncharacterized protein n=1 Tax=Hymenobacter setariae TaxID=2594794 RepID=A0A558BU92_9BACT|nr:hypothetical protein [Hymenobacter setariae]TVT40088.1 hypothetical protein FNT36_11340 [Hymenobacter setariae]